MRRYPVQLRGFFQFGVLGAAGLAVSGCGHSTAQEYSRIHSIVIAAEPADGAIVASSHLWETQPGLAKAIATADRGRGHASDSVMVGD